MMNGVCSCSCSSQSAYCGCCEGIRAITPVSHWNRPGLTHIRYRAGTHAAFFETMKARLSSVGTPDDPNAKPLLGLTTRSPDDFSIALLDGWSTVADVLTFYQERIAQEGYLDTATERRSIRELANLIGYSLRPGVAASVFLALTLDKDHDVMIAPFDVRVQNVPGPGETAQTFENIEPLDARYAWNELKPRLTRPQTAASIAEGTQHDPRARIYLDGTSTNLKPNDVVLLTGTGPQPQPYSVAEVAPDSDKNVTLVTFHEVATQPASAVLARTLLEIASDAAIALENRVSTLSPDDQQTAREAIDRIRAIASAARLQPATGRPVIATELDALASLDAKTPSDSPLRPMLAILLDQLRKTTGEQSIAVAREKALAFNLAMAPSVEAAFVAPSDPLASPMGALTKPASIPPRNSQTLDRSLAGGFSQTGDLGVQVASTLDARLRESLPATLANVQVTADSSLRAFAFRAVARPFGHNAPLRAIVTTKQPTRYEEWTTDDPLGTGSGKRHGTTPHQDDQVLYLDAEYKIQPSGWVRIVDSASGPDLILNLDPAAAQATATNLSFGGYGLSGKSTRLDLSTAAWMSGNKFDQVRNTIVYCESEELTLANETIEDPISGDEEQVELDGVYSGLQSGRWVVVTGERADILDASGNAVRGVQSAELVMLSDVQQTVDFVDQSELGVQSYGYAGGPQGLPGDLTHTYITFAKPLEYCYFRDGCTIYGNVLKATHGETRKEKLGSGDATVAYQRFSLSQSPLTFVASPTPSGAASTLKIYVNEVEWHEFDSLIDAGPRDRAYVTKTDEAAKASVIFGNGLRGSRLPTGNENVRAEYRSGIGAAANVPAEQITQLLSKPLGVKGVTNPLRASGGADRESMDTARKNAPLTVTALDRLVSVSDYADFARTFAGIGKSESAMVTDGKRQWVHVTIAGADDIPIDESSDLFRNLLEALRDFGDPNQPVMLQVRELFLLAVAMNVQILPDYEWEPVVGTLRTSMLARFGFERQELAEPVYLSDVIATAQATPGVQYVEVTAFGGIPEKTADVDSNGQPIRRLLTPQEISDAVAAFVGQNVSPSSLPWRIRAQSADFESGTMRPAQLACFTPAVADTLVVNQVK